MKAGNIIAALFLIALSTVFFVSALEFGPGVSGDVGPGFFPKIISGLIIFCSILVIWQELKKNSKEKLINPHMLKALSIVAMTIVYLLLLEVIGFMILTTLLILGVLYLIGERNLLLNLAVAVGLSVLIFISFRMGLNVRLPEPLFRF